jgi:hypothetical protein
MQKPVCTHLWGMCRRILVDGEDLGVEQHLEAFWLVLR